MALIMVEWEGEMAKSNGTVRKQGSSRIREGQRDCAGNIGDTERQNAPWTIKTPGFESISENLGLGI